MELKRALEKTKGSYYAFVVAVLTYVNNKRTRYEIVMDYLRQTPEASTEDILEFISRQDDFVEDAAFETAEKIV